MGVVESVKAASDLYSPLKGKITDVNSKLSEDPSLVNRSPYDEGTLLLVTLDKQIKIKTKRYYLSL